MWPRPPHHPSQYRPAGYPPGGPSAPVVLPPSYYQPPPSADAVAQNLAQAAEQWARMQAPQIAQQQQQFYPPQQHQPAPAYQQQFPPSYPPQQYAPRPPQQFQHQQYPPALHEPDFSQDFHQQAPAQPQSTSWNHQGPPALHALNDQYIPQQQQQYHEETQFGAPPRGPPPAVPPGYPPRMVAPTYVPPVAPLGFPNQQPSYSQPPPGSDGRFQPPVDGFGRPMWTPAAPGIPANRCPPPEAPAPVPAEPYYNYTIEGNLEYVDPAYEHHYNEAGPAYANFDFESVALSHSAEAIKKLPPWIREGLEKLEREKQKEREKQRFMQEYESRVKDEGTGIPKPSWSEVSPKEGSSSPHSRSRSGSAVSMRSVSRSPTPFTAEERQTAILQATKELVTSILMGASGRVLEKSAAEEIESRKTLLKQASAKPAKKSAALAALAQFGSSDSDSDNDNTKDPSGLPPPPPGVLKKMVTAQKAVDVLSGISSRSPTPDIKNSPGKSLISGKNDGKISRNQDYKSRRSRSKSDERSQGNNPNPSKQVTVSDTSKSMRDGEKVKLKKAERDSDKPVRKSRWSPSCVEKSMTKASSSRQQNADSPASKRKAVPSKYSSSSSSSSPDPTRHGDSSRICRRSRSTEDVRKSDRTVKSIDQKHSDSRERRNTGEKKELRGDESKKSSSHHSSERTSSSSRSDRRKEKERSTSKKDERDVADDRQKKDDPWTQPSSSSKRDEKDLTRKEVTSSKSKLQSVIQRPSPHPTSDSDDRGDRRKRYT